MKETTKALGVGLGVVLGLSVAVVHLGGRARKSKNLREDAGEEAASEVEEEARMEGLFPAEANVAEGETTEEEEEEEEGTPALEEEEVVMEPEAEADAGLEAQEVNAETGEDSEDSEEDSEYSEEDSEDCEDESGSETEFAEVDETSEAAAAPEDEDEEVAETKDLEVQEEEEDTTEAEDDLDDDAEDILVEFVAVDYVALQDRIRGLLAEETDPVTNCANCAAAIWEALIDAHGSDGANWVGFYRCTAPSADPDEVVLQLGPFMGRPACGRIPLGKGVCGTAAATGASQLVADVHTFPGHIACDGRSRSELVVPIFASEDPWRHRLVAVLDLDCPILAGFSDADRRELEDLMCILGEACDWNAPESPLLVFPVSQEEQSLDAVNLVVAGHAACSGFRTVRDAALAAAELYPEDLEVQVEEHASEDGFRSWLEHSVPAFESGTGLAETLRRKGTSPFVWRSSMVRRSPSFVCHSNAGDVGSVSGSCGSTTGSPSLASTGGSGEFPSAEHAGSKNIGVGGGVFTKKRLSVATGGRDFVGAAEESFEWLRTFLHTRAPDASYGW